MDILVRHRYGASDCLLYLSLVLSFTRPLPEQLYTSVPGDMSDVILSLQASSTVVLKCMMWNMHTVVSSLHLPQGLPSSCVLAPTMSAGPSAAS